MPAWTWSARKVEKKLFISAEECKCVLDAMQCMSFIPDAVLLKITTMHDVRILSKTHKKSCLKHD